jgi:endonuclease YncB( thermonuclease family)
VNAAMVQRGAAWAYRDYLRDPRLIAVEAQAKSARVGLWALPAGQRLPPWEYRAARRDAAGVVVGR